MQDVPVHATRAERGLHQADMPVLPRVAAGHHRQGLLRIGKVVRVERPGRDEGRQLKRLGR
jgi:hypothetical protein